MAIIDETISKSDTTTNGKPDFTIIKRTQNAGTNRERWSYYARHYIPEEKRSLNKVSNKVYVFKSLSTRVLADATSKAIRQSIEIRQWEKDNRAFRSVTVRDAFNQFITHYDERLKANVEGYSIHMYRGYKKTVQRYVLEYLDSRKVYDIESISYNDFEDYEIWRRQYWKDPSKKSELEKNGNISKNPTNRTIQWDLTLWKSFLKWCKNHDLLFGNVPEYTIHKGIGNSRIAFSNSQWESITRYMRTNDFLRGGLKHHTDSRIEWHRHQLRAFVLLLGYTGMRPGEALSLRWGDIHEHGKDEADRPTGVAYVKSTHTKTGKGREIFILHTGWRALMRLKDIRKKSANDSIKEYLKNTDYIFCRDNGDKKNELREGFRRLIDNTGIGLDREGNPFVPYSCRHFYITKRIENGVDPYVIAKQCGTSIPMIQHYYDSTSTIDHIDALSRGIPQWGKKSVADNPNS